MPEMPDRAELGRALRTLREAKELSQEDLADLSGLHRTYVGGVERGERNPSFESISRLLGALNATWTQLAHRLERPRDDA